MSSWLAGLRPRRTPTADPRDFAALTAPLHGRLYQAARVLCGDPVEAEDLAQEALVRGLRAFHRFDHDAALYPWLLRILRNTYLDEVRSARARRLTLPAVPPDPADPGAGPEEALEAEQAAARVHRALATLPPDQALVVTLVDLQGLGYGEAAQALGLPVGTVRSRLSRARDRLRHALRQAPDRTAQRASRSRAAP